MYFLYELQLSVLRKFGDKILNLSILSWSVNLSIVIIFKFNLLHKASLAILFAQ